MTSWQPDNHDAQQETPNRIIDPQRDTNQNPRKDDRDRDQVTQPNRQLPGDGELGTDSDDGNTNVPQQDPEREYDQN